MGGVQKTVNCILRKLEVSGRILVVSQCQRLCLRQADIQLVDAVKQVIVSSSIMRAKTDGIREGAHSERKESNTPCVA
jgi:hypothetical protein